MDGAQQNFAPTARDSLAAPAFAVLRLDGEALALWRAHEEAFSGTAYQTSAFVLAFLDSLPPQHKEHARLVVGREAGGRVMFLLPVMFERSGPLCIARPVGGAHANFSLPLFDPDACVKFSPDFILASLKQSLVAAGCDLLYLPHAPVLWLGHANPLSAASHRASINVARYASLLPDANASLRSLRSKDSLRKLAAKRKKLAAKGILGTARASTSSKKSALIDAYKSLKDRWSRQRGISNEFSDRVAADFYQRLAGLDDFLMWSLKLDDELIGVCGGFRQGSHVSMMIISSEQERYAVFTPGDILIEAVISDLCDQRVSSFDFGTGEAEYKRRWLSHDVGLVDIVQPVTFAGQAAGHLMTAMLACKGFIKSRPQLHRLVHLVRQQKPGTRSNMNQTMAFKA